MTDTVAIIGCGPAGLLAAYASERRGWEPVVFSASVRPSPDAKATFLHSSIPGLTSDRPDAHMKLAKVGTAGGYARKAYGDDRRSTSWERFQQGTIRAWDLAPVYAELWRRYRGRVNLMIAGPGDARDLVDSYDLVINAASAPALCAKGHEFPRREIWVKDGAPAGVGINTMIYNGSRHYDWYRSSDVFGRRATEYGEEVEGADRGIKVKRTSCNCHPKIKRVGRWGRWMPGVLLDQAFADANRILYHAREGAHDVV